MHHVPSVPSREARAAAQFRRGDRSGGRHGFLAGVALTLAAVATVAALAGPFPVVSPAPDSPALLAGARTTVSGTAGSHPGTPDHGAPPAGDVPSTAGTSPSGAPAAAAPVTPAPVAPAPATSSADTTGDPAGDERPDPSSSDPTAGAVEVGPGAGTAARLEQALATSLLVTMPPGEYVFERAPVLPDNARIVGAGKALTKWFRTFDGDFAVLPESATLENLAIQGQGAQFGGRGLVLTGDDGRQVLDNVAVLGFEGYCIDFETIHAGSQFRAEKLDVARYNADPTGDRYAVHMADGFQNSAVPRSFFQVETQGSPFAYLGGSNDVYVTASTVGGMQFTENTRGFHLGVSRWLNQPAVEIHGHGITVTGVGIRPAVTIMPGADDVHFDGSYFNAGAVDRSGAGNNTGLPAR